MRVRYVRNAIQSVVALGLLYAGWQFYRFVSHFMYDTAFVSRPPVVEAFLPISALVALKTWVATGVYTMVHPAGLAILLAALATAVLFHRGLCSWLCPFGLLSEHLAALGDRLLGWTFEPPRLLDYALRSLKFVVLFFFLKVVFVDFTVREAVAFMHAPFNKIAAVKMLYFWLQPSLLTLGVVVVLVVGSTTIQNFWCRYFCPYGALLSVVGRVSPVAARVTSDGEDCTECGQCVAACPNYVDVESVDEVTSLECTRCSRCVEACPNGSLGLSVGPAPLRTRVSPRTVGAGVVVVFVLVVAVAVATGHWESGVDYHEYARLIPQVHDITHRTHG